MSNTTTTITTNQPTVDVVLPGTNNSFTMKQFSMSSTIADVLRSFGLDRNRVVFVNSGEGVPCEVLKLVAHEKKLEVLQRYKMNDLVKLLQGTLSTTTTTTTEERPANPELQLLREECRETQELLRDVLKLLNQRSEVQTQHFRLNTSSEEEVEDEVEEEVEKVTKGLKELEVCDTPKKTPKELVQAEVVLDGKTKFLELEPGLDYESFVDLVSDAFGFSLETHSVHFTKGTRNMRTIPRSSFQCIASLSLLGGAPKKRHRSEVEPSNPRGPYPIYPENYTIDIDESMQEPDYNELLRAARKLRKIDIDVWLQTLTIDQLRVLEEDVCNKHKGSSSMASRPFINQLAHFVEEFRNLEELEKQIVAAKTHVATVVNTAYRRYGKSLSKSVGNQIAAATEREETNRIREELATIRSQARELINREQALIQREHRVQQRENQQRANNNNSNTSNTPN